MASKTRRMNSPRPGIPEEGARGQYGSEKGLELQEVFARVLRDSVRTGPVEELVRRMCAGIL